MQLLKLNWIFYNFFRYRSWQGLFQVSFQKVQHTPEDRCVEKLERVSNLMNLYWDQLIMVNRYDIRWPWMPTNEYRFFFAFIFAGKSILKIACTKIFPLQEYPHHEIDNFYWMRFNEKLICSNTKEFYLRILFAGTIIHSCHLNHLFHWEVKKLENFSLYFTIYNILFCKWYPILEFVRHSLLTFYNRNINPNNDK